MASSSHAEALRQLAETLVQLAKAKQTVDELAGAQGYGEQVITQVNVARATINDAFDSTDLAIKRLREHEQRALVAAASQGRLFTEGAEAGEYGGGDAPSTAEGLEPDRIPPPDDSELGGGDDDSGDGGGNVTPIGGKRGRKKSGHN